MVQENSESRQFGINQQIVDFSEIDMSYLGDECPVCGYDSAMVHETDSIVQDLVKCSRCCNKVSQDAY
jgi:hypothetical protein